MTPRMALMSDTLAFTYDTSPPSFSIRSMALIFAETASSAWWLLLQVFQDSRPGRLERPTNTSLARYFLARYSEIAMPRLPSPPVIRYTPHIRNGEGLRLVLP